MFLDQGTCLAEGVVVASRRQLTLMPWSSFLVIVVGTFWLLLISTCFSVLLCGCSLVVLLNFFFLSVFIFVGTFAN